MRTLLINGRSRRSSKTHTIRLPDLAAFAHCPAQYGEGNRLRGQANTPHRCPDIPSPSSCGLCWQVGARCGAVEKQYVKDISDRGDTCRTWYILTFITPSERILRYSAFRRTSLTAASATSDMLGDSDEVWYWYQPCVRYRCLLGGVESAVESERRIGKSNTTDRRG